MLRSGTIVAHDTMEHIRNSLTGKVFTVSVEADQVPVWQKRYPISNMQPVGSRILLRLISPDGIPEGAVAAEPDLEDAYLAYCGQEDVC